MKRKSITFINSKGIKLSGTLALPEEKSVEAYAIFAHCFTCNKNLINVKYISEAMSEKGIAVLRLDFTGLGESEGNFAETDFSTNVQDLMDAANFLTKNYEAPKLLVGHSLGGAASIVAADRLQSVRALAVIGTPSSLDHIRRLFKTRLDEIYNNGSAFVNVEGREVEISKDFIESLSAYHIKKILNNLEKPILILHSPQDETVSINHATEIFMAAAYSKSFVSLDNMHHLIKKPEEAKYAGNLIYAWSQRYVQ